MRFSEEEKPEYVKLFPFRFVKPYSHRFETHAKKRWLGREILETLIKEFAAYDQAYFKKAIEDGKILMNGKKVSINYIIKNSDLLTHQTIREEPPILDVPIEIICDNQEFVVVNKPPSMIVHTGGGYHYNTLLAILHYEHNYKGLYVLHRIDRLTSGVVIFAKNKGKTSKFHEENQNQEMKKSYFARVSGNFLYEEHLLKAPIICLSHKDGVFSVYDPKTMEDKLKNQQLKESVTLFKKIWYDQKTDSSLLECSPITGRTHQIRVHLQYLGHPILNDVVYGGKFVGNQMINKMEQLGDSLEIIDQVEKRVNGEDKYESKEKEKEEEEDRIKEIKEQMEKKWIGKWDFQTRPWEIYLHSFKYTFQGKQFLSAKPYWTEKDSLDLRNFQDKQKHDNFENAANVKEKIVNSDRQIFKIQRQKLDKETQKQ